MKTQLSIQMRILSFEDLAARPAQLLDNIFLRAADLQAALFHDLLAQRRQIVQPGAT